MAFLLIKAQALRFEGSKYGFALRMRIQGVFLVFQQIFDKVIESKNLLDPEAPIGAPRFFALEHLDQRKESQFLPTLLARKALTVFA